MSPNIREIEACHPWLERELALVRPRVVVALGGSAARALLGRPVVLARQRGALQPFGDGRELLPTVHPSYLLRLRDGEARERERRQFVAELAIAAARAGATR